MKKIEVEWTGQYPALCFGEWKIKIDGRLLKSKKDKDFFDCHLGTPGKYDRWIFDDEYIEQWETYEETLDKDWWETEMGIRLSNILKENNIELTAEEKQELYNKLSEQDWRHNSCGGCI